MNGGQTPQYIFQYLGHEFRKASTYIQEIYSNKNDIVALVKNEATADELIARLKEQNIKANALSDGKGGYIINIREGLQADRFKHIAGTGFPDPDVEIRAQAERERAAAERNRQQLESARPGNEILHSQEWKPYGPQLSTSVKNPHEAAALEKALRDKGFNPTSRFSASEDAFVINIKSTEVPKLKEILATAETISHGLAKAADAVSDAGKKAGPVLGPVLGVVAGVVALAGGAKPAHAMQIAAEAAIDPAETAFALARGDKQGAREAGAALSTSAAGAVIGQTLIPVPVVGAAIGGIVGDISGRYIAAAEAKANSPEVIAGRKEITERLHANPAPSDATATAHAHTRPASALAVRTPAEQKVLNDLFGSDNSPKADQRAEKGPGALFRDNAKNVTDAETRNGPLTAGFTNQADANAGFSLWRSPGLSGPR